MHWGEGFGYQWFLNMVVPQNLLVAFIKVYIYLFFIEISEVQLRPVKSESLRVQPRLLSFVNCLVLIISLQVHEPLLRDRTK